MIKNGLNLSILILIDNAGQKTYICNMILDNNIKRKINILPDFLANQIAAGEVVQKPESVVKELVENSIDSGADTIVVLVKNAGKQLIHIVDNGSGMSKDDLELSVLRHATSKIISSEDLENINTLGFRGEALASISSVAHLEIRTRRQEDEHGWKLISEPNTIPVIEPVNTDVGTQVFVRNLFYNVPARRKFLKSNITEFRYISDTMMKFSLGNLKIRFTFYDDDNLIFDLWPGSSSDRMIKLLGKNMTGKLLQIDFENEFISITGLIGLPESAKSNRSGQFLFLNNRNIISRSINHAVYTAFENIIEKNSHPVYCISLKIDPHKVDVNVHPQKHEVKFDDERPVYNSVLLAVRDALRKFNIIPDGFESSTDIRSPFMKSGDENDEKILVNRMTGEIIDSSISNLPNRSYSSERNSESPSGVRFEGNLRTAYEELFNSDNLPTNDFTELISGLLDEISSSNFNLINNELLFSVIDDRVFIVDIRSAIERIIYDSVYKTDIIKAESQNLLFPEVFELDNNLSEVLIQLLPDLNKIGFEMEIVAGKVTLYAVPTNIESSNSEKLLKEFATDYLSDNRTSHKEKLAGVYAKRTANNMLTSVTAESLISIMIKLLESDLPSVSPSGSRVLRTLGINELRNLF